MGGQPPAMTVTVNGFAEVHAPRDLVSIERALQDGIRPTLDEGASSLFFGHEQCHGYFLHQPDNKIITVLVIRFVPKSDHPPYDERLGIHSFQQKEGLLLVR